MTLISVVVPTIPGREDLFELVIRAYFDRTGYDLELIPQYGHPTVGCAWQAGADQASGEYIHLGNDDCEPHPGWAEPAVEAVEAGFIPSPQVYAPDGTPQGLPAWGVVDVDWTPVSCAMIPFLSRKQWLAIRPLLTSHYYTDNWITTRARNAGWRCRLRTGYAFTHHWAQPGRGAGMTEPDRMAYDERLYHAALLMAQNGQWTEPWPPGGRLP